MFRKYLLIMQKFKFCQNWEECLRVEQCLKQTTHQIRKRTKVVQYRHINVYWQSLILGLWVADPQWETSLLPLPKFWPHSCSIITPSWSESVMFSICACFGTKFAHSFQITWEPLSFVFICNCKGSISCLVSISASVLVKYTNYGDFL